MAEPTKLYSVKDGSEITLTYGKATINQMVASGEWSREPSYFFAEYTDEAVKDKAKELGITHVGQKSRKRLEGEISEAKAK